MLNQQQYGDNFIPIIPTNSIVHTDKNPHCGDTECPCYDALKASLHQYYMDGLVSADDATRILEGKTI